MYDNTQNRTRPGSLPRTRPEHFRRFHDPRGTAKLSTTLVHALADAMGADPTDCRSRLLGVVDLTSLDHLFPRPTEWGARPPGHVAFTVEGYRVTVYESGQIVVTPPVDGAQ